MSSRKLIQFLILALISASCQSGAQSADQPSATSKPASAATAVPTEAPTALPSDTPLPSATPGPVVVKDDFAAQSDVWGKCENCTWKDGALFFGPFPPKGSGTDQIFYMICEACGTHTFYRAAVDVTFVDGYGDRTFGILAGLTGNKFIGAATVSTLKHALYETFDFNSNQWGGTSFKMFNAVRAGRGINHIEVRIKPGASAGKADIFVSVNDKNVITLFEQPIEPSQAGLYLGWHSVGVSFDNFEYEESVP